MSDDDLKKAKKKSLQTGKRRKVQSACSDINIYMVEKMKKMEEPKCLPSA